MRMTMKYKEWAWIKVQEELMKIMKNMFKNQQKQVILKKDNQLRCLK